MADNPRKAKGVKPRGQPARMAENAGEGQDDGCDQVPPADGPRHNCAAGDITRAVPLAAGERISALGVRALEAILGRLPTGEMLNLTLSLDDDNEITLGLVANSTGASPATWATSASDLDLAADLLVERVNS